MQSYHDHQGALPARALFNKEGKPLLSWRVLILPYMEQDALYKQFKLDEPWDSLHNIKLLEKMPSFYKPFAGHQTREPYTTYFQVFVGKGAAFEGTKGMKISSDFPDGISNTILIAQAKHAVPWTKPEDLNFGPDLPLPELGGIFPKTFQVATVDTSTRSLPDDISEKTLRAAITRNGKDELGEDWR